MVLRFRADGHILPDALALHLLQLLHQRQVDAVGVVDKAVGVGHGDHLGAQGRGLFAGVDGHIAGAGDGYLGALKAAARVLEHIVGKVAQTIAGGLGSGQRAAVAEALAGEGRR